MTPADIMKSTEVTISVKTGDETITMKVAPEELNWTLEELKQPIMFRGVLEHLAPRDMHVSMTLRGKLIPEPIPEPDPCMVCDVPAWRVHYIFGLLVCDTCMNPWTEIEDDYDYYLDDEPGYPPY